MTEAEARVTGALQAAYSAIRGLMRAARTPEAFDAGGDAMLAISKLYGCANPSGCGCDADQRPECPYGAPPSQPGATHEQ